MVFLNTGTNGPNAKLKKGSNSRWMLTGIKLYLITDLQEIKFTGFSSREFKDFKDVLLVFKDI